MARALITGITGQDGSFLAKFLLSKGYEVYGIVRRTSTQNLWRLMALDVLNKVTLIPGDVTDPARMYEVIRDVKPDEVYHLASQSHVGFSFENPVSTSEATGLSVLYLLDAIRRVDTSIRFYFAGSSELFGNVKSNGPLNEDTPFHPESPYAVAKLYGYWMTRVYRESYGMFAVSGILFNHESELRGLDFVTRKISNAVARIVLGLQRDLALGNLKAKRDWGYAPEYVEAMYLMLSNERPVDYVVATGETHSVEEFVQEAFDYVGLDYHEYVRVDPRYMRPNDVNVLLGDHTRITNDLGWKPRTIFKELVHKMVNADIDRWTRYIDGEPVVFDAIFSSG